MPNDSSKGPDFFTKLKRLLSKLKRLLPELKGVLIEAFILISIALTLLKWLKDEILGLFRH
jgi:hypothetical protein